jgi:O-antigen ligase
LAELDLASADTSDVDERVEIDAVLAKSLILGFVVLFFYLPNAQVGQARAIATAVLALAVLCLPTRLDRTAIALVLISLAACAEILTSIVVNLGPRQSLAHGIVAAFKPFYFALMYLLGYVCVSNSRLRADGLQVRRLFTLVASFFICTQLAVGLVQAVGAANALDSIYYQEKTRDVTTILRVTGTIGNPNSLAFYTLQCFLFILLLGTANWLWKAVLLLFGASLIALTGSRSVLIVFILCLVVFVFFRRKSLSAWIAYFLMTFLFVSALILIVQMYAEYFRYLSQLQLLLTTDSPLSRVSSMAARMEHWDNSLALFNSHEGIAKYLVGLGARIEYSVLDNDYLYVTLRYGVFGLVLFYGFYAFLATRYIDRSMDGGARFFVLLVFFATIILGFVGEFFASWYHTAFFIMITGALSAVQSPVRWLQRER